MTDVNGENLLDQPDNDDQREGGAHAAESTNLPLRGLAMVLIAVAVLLGLWGLYSLTQTGNKGDDQDVTNGQPAIESPVDDGPASGVTTVPPTAQKNAQAQQNKESAAAQSGEKQATQGQSAQRQENNNAADAKAVSAVKVNVLNNSTESKLAESTFNSLKDQGITMGEHGNLPGNVLTVGETTVFYNEGDAAGQKAAEELADRIARTNGVNAVAKPNDAALDKKLTGNGQITLVLMGKVHV